LHRKKKDPVRILWKGKKTSRRRGETAPPGKKKREIVFEKHGRPKKILVRPGKKR